MKKKIINLLLVIVILIMIATNILIYKNNNKEISSQNINNENVTQKNWVTDNNINRDEIMQNVIDNRLENMPELSRIQTYFGTFMTFIENRNYERAYNILNEDFKNNYFPTIETFEKYFEEYPQNIMVNYKNVDRQGEIFVLTVEISDMFNDELEPINKRVVIREKGLNDFKISFQVE